jgi:hypothetical protein
MAHTGSTLIVSGGSPAAAPLFADNIATGDGGAIAVKEYNNLTIGPNVRFQNNQAGKYYDGMTNPTGANLNIDYTNVTFTNPFHFAFNNADVTADPSIPANYTAPYVRFDPQGGDVQPAEQIIDPAGDMLAAAPSVNPRLFGKVFKGWFTEPIGGVKWDFSKPVTDGMTSPAAEFGLTLYAQYRDPNNHERCIQRWSKGRRTPV